MIPNLLERLEAIQRLYIKEATDPELRPGYKKLCALIAEVKAVETAEMTFWRFGDLGDSLGELLQRMCSKEGFLQHYPGAQEEVHVLITRGKEREHGRE